MMERTRVLVGLASVIISSTVQSANGDVMLFSDRDQWQAAVGSSATVDFTGFPSGMIITDQYADLGVTFTDGDDRIFLNSSFENDGAGLNGVFDIVTEFSAPTYAIAVDFPGFIQFELFSGPLLIYSSPPVGGGGTGWFVGLISDQPFDRAVLDGVGAPAQIDDLHFGPVPAPASLALFGLAACFARCRRRS